MTGKTQSIYFLEWLKKRLLFRYNESEQIISNIDHILQNYILVPKKISPTKIDNICRKYYYDFDMDESEINMGYSEESRNKIRQMVFGIASEICGDS